MNRFFSADYILPVSGSPIKNGVVKVGREDEILGVYAPGDVEIDGPFVERQGLIVPGFVNTHCHLELSHLKGRIPKHTGLVPFIEQVMATRKKVKDSTIQAAMEKADTLMFENGIVAVGDHANTSLSKGVKAKSPIHYHTFVEVMGFDPGQASERLQNSLDICSEFPINAASVTPHAPYSVSKALYLLFRDAVKNDVNAISIHNQESREENKFYRYKTGDFMDFYQRMGVEFPEFKAQSRNSLQTTIPYLPKKAPIILVHNIYTSARDIFYLERMEKQVTWCLCPNANRYIEDTLPKVTNFMQSDFPIALGTDSLASNDGLCILSELKTLHAAFEKLDLRKTIPWATINGAKALGIDDRYGSLDPGKRPGLNLLTHTLGFELTSKTRVERLV